MLELKKMFALLAIAGALVVTGCDDEGGGGGKDGAVKDDADVEEDASVGTDADVVAEGACTNADDATAIGTEEDEVATYGGGGDKTVADVTYDCAVSNIATPDGEFISEVADCVNAGTDDAVSVECATCYAGSSKCGKDNCLADCLGAADSDCCQACRCDNECYSTFADCSGRPETDTCENLSDFDRADCAFTE